jgi:hypothetical protein
VEDEKPSCDERGAIGKEEPIPEEREPYVLRNLLRMSRSRSLGEP